MSRRAAIVFGIANILTAGLLAFGVFVALPARWWPVDAAASALIALELASGLGLLLGVSWATRASFMSSAASLLCGLFAITALALAASWLSGVYGSVGQGGAIILVLVAALVLPYVVLLPVLELLWLRRGAGPAR